MKACLLYIEIEQSDVLLIGWQFDIFWKIEIIILFGKESSGGDCRASQRPTPLPLHLLPDRSHANAGTWDSLFRRTLDHTLRNLQRSILTSTERLTEFTRDIYKITLNKSIEL